MQAAGPGTRLGRRFLSGTSLRMVTAFAMVAPMSDQQQEPGEVTDRFRAFAQSDDPQPSKALPFALIAVGAALLVVLITTIIVLGSS